MAFKEKLIDILHKSRVFLLVLTGTIIVGVFVIGIYSDITARRARTSFEAIEAVQNLYDQLSLEDEEEVAELHSRIENIINQYPDIYAVARARFIRAELAFTQEDWQTAAQDYLYIAQNFDDTHIASISFYNAAVASENDGNIDMTIEILEQFLERYQIIGAPEIARAQFSLGRLHEDIDREEALRYYNMVINQNSESEWATLAQNRLIAFQHIDG